MNGINTIKYLSQQDPRWRDIKIGNSQYTVGNYGCALTCISMVSDYFGCFQDPGQLAVNPKVAPDGSVNWTTLDFPNFSFRYADGNLFSSKFSPDNEMLKSYLDNNGKGGDRACIIQLVITPYKNGTPFTHFLLGLWALPETNDIMVIDPWDGKSKPLLLSYPSGRINEVCYFQRWDKTKHNGKQAWQGQIKPVAPLYN